MESVESLQLLSELVAVFLGVSLSFYVADVRDRRTDARKARQALLGIRSDLAAELGAVRWLLDVYGPSAAAAESLYHDWNNLPNITKKAEDTFYLLHMGAPFSPARAHYEAAKSAGVLALIEHESLRSSLAALFEQQHAYLRGINEFSVEFDFEFLRQLRPYLEYKETKHKMTTYVVKGEAAPPISVALLDGAAERLRIDSVTRNSMYLMFLFRSFFAQLLETYRNTINELDAAIAKYLGQSTA